MRYTCELNVWRGDSNDDIPMWLFRSIVYMNDAHFEIRVNTTDGRVSTTNLSRGDFAKYVFWTYSNTNMDSCYVDTVEVFARMGAVPYKESIFSPRINPNNPFHSPYTEPNVVPCKEPQPYISWCGDSVEDIRGRGSSAGGVALRPDGDLVIGRVGGAIHTVPNETPIKWIVTVNGSDIQADSNGVYTYAPTVVANASSTRTL